MLGLILSGIAMEMAGSSRPASGKPGSPQGALPDRRHPRRVRHRGGRRGPGAVAGTPARD